MKFLVFAAVVLAVCAYANGEDCCGGLPRRKVKVCEDHNPEVKVIYTGNPCECQKALPYKIEVPVVEKQILRKHKYVVEKTSQPKPKPCFIYNAKIEKPVNTQEIQYEGLKTAIDRIVLPARDCPQPCEQPEPESAEICCQKCKKTKESCGCRNVIVKVKSCKKCQESSEEIGCGCQERSIESCGCNKPHESSEEICQKSSEEKIEYCSEEIDCGCSKCQKPKKTCGCGKIYSSEESDCGCGKYEECKKIKYSSEEMDCGCKRCQESEEESEECKKIRYSSEEIDCGCRKCQPVAVEKVCGCNRRPVSSCESCGKIVQESSEEISCGCQVRPRPCQEKKVCCEESEEEICTKDSDEAGNCGCSKCTQQKHECESEEESVERCGCGNKKRVHVKYGKFYRYLDKNYGVLQNNNNNNSPLNNEDILTSNSNTNTHLHSNSNLRYDNRMKRHLDNNRNINQLSEEDSHCNQLKRTKREFFLDDMQDCAIVSEPKPQYEIDNIFKEIKESEKRALLHNADIFSESDSDSYNSASDSAESASTLKYSTEDIIDITANITAAVDLNNLSTTENINNVDTVSSTDLPFIENVTDDNISSESLIPESDDLFTTELPIIDLDISDNTTESLKSETTQNSDDQYDDSIETSLFDNSTPIYNTESSLSIENFENNSFDDNISAISETESTETSTIAETVPAVNNFFKLFFGSGTNENENLTSSEITTENSSGITLDIIDSDENIDSTTKRFKQNTEISESTTQLPVSKITTEVDSNLNTKNIDLTTVIPSTTFKNPNLKFADSSESSIDLTSSTVVPNLLASSTIPNFEVSTSTQSPQDSSTTIANKPRRRKGDKRRSKTKRKNPENREKRSIDDYYFEENVNTGHKFISNQKSCACCTIQNLIRHPKYDRSQLVCSGCLQFLPEILPNEDSNRDSSRSVYKTCNSYDSNYKKYKPSYYNLNRGQDNLKYFIPKYGYDAYNYNTKKYTNIHYPAHRNYNSDCVNHRYSYPEFKYQDDIQKINKYQVKDSTDMFDKHYTSRCPTILKLMEKNKYNNAFFDQASLPQYLPEIVPQPKFQNTYYVSHTENCNPRFYKPRQRRHTFKYDEDKDIPVKVTNNPSKSSKKSIKHCEEKSTEYNFQPAIHDVKKSHHKLKRVEKFQDHSKPQLYYQYLSLMAPKKTKFGYVNQEYDENSTENEKLEYTNIKNRNLKASERKIEGSEESSEYDDTSEDHSIDSNYSELLDDDNIEEKNEGALSKINKDLNKDKYCPCGCGMLKSECSCCQKSGKHSKCCKCPNCKLHASKSDSLDLHSHPNFDNNHRHNYRNERNSKHTDNLTVHKLNLLSDVKNTQNSGKSEFSTENLLQSTENVDSNTKIVYDHLGHKYIEHDGFRKLIKPKFDIFDEDFERSSPSRQCIRDVINVKDFDTEDAVSQQNDDENIKAEVQAKEEENKNTETEVIQVSTEENVQKNMSRDNEKENVERLTDTTIESVQTSTDGKDDIIRNVKQNGENESTISVSTNDPKSSTTQISTTNNLKTSDTIVAKDSNTKLDFYKNLLEHVIQKTELRDKFKTEKLKLENLFKTDFTKNPNFHNCDAYIKFLTTKLNQHNSTELSSELANSIDSIISNNHTVEYFITLMRFKQKFDEKYANFESTTESKVMDDLYKRMLENVFQSSELYDNYKNYLILKKEFDNLKNSLRLVDYSIQEFFNNCQSSINDKVTDSSSTEKIESNTHYSSTPKTNTEYYTKKIEVYPIFK